MKYPRIVVNSIGVPEADYTETEVRPLWPDSFINWLEPRLKESFRVFEWGSGNSSLWIKPRVSCITSVEHHANWHWVMRANFPEQRIVKAFNDFDYESTIGPFGAFDMIIIDGVRRNECIRKSVPALTPDGVIILDNSDSEAFEGQAWLREQGFSEKVFSGEYAWAKNGEIHSTTVFWKDGNCLGITNTESGSESSAAAPPQ